MRSIQARVSRTLCLGLGGLLATLNVAVGALGWRAQSEAFDERLLERARALATLVVQKGPYVELEFADGLMPEYARAERPDHFQVWVLGEGGGVLERSLGLGAHDLPRPRAGDVGPRFDWLRLPDGREGRVVRLAAPIHEYEPEGEDGKAAGRRDVAIAVATGRAPLTAARLRLLGWMLAADALFALGSALVVRLTLRRGLAPIQAFSARVAAVQRPDQLAELTALVAPAELRPIADSVEQMLGRLRDAFARERNLSGNIAHELRTPVAELRLAADVALERPDDAAGLARAVREARDIAVEMERTISTLLRLWRETRTREESFGVTELHAVLRDALRGAAPTAAAREVALPEPPDGGLHVAVAERPLALVLANLVQNAAAHGARGAAVTLRSTRDAARVALALENQRERLDGLDPERVFEPFYSTRRGTRHAGLGLPLARALCEASGMELDVEVADDRFRARLSIPVADAGQGSTAT